MYGHVLRPEDLLGRAVYGSAVPAPSLTPWVERYWSVRWELGPGEMFPVSTLDDPSLHLTIERGGVRRDGTDGAGDWITGPVTRGRFDVQLTGSGSVLGVKFALGGTTAFVHADLRALRDRTVPASDWFPDTSGSLHGIGDLPADAEQAAPRLDAWLMAAHPADSHEMPAVRHVLALLEDPRTRTLAELEERSGFSARSLQRLVDRNLGVGVKRMLMRARVIDATAAIDHGDPRTLGQLALDLGWFDQSHFIRDFRAVTGETPARYAGRLRG
ncbi:AraC family transcriptional regulator [Brachybacterium endophyticum]|uniref:AraC family transcriptional regulator n=2 Tax=Brachybacterium endophyticum TaxID=2182385 RepID=A0A2U2RHZ7_9MICO|nr:AraC family transcriptional regulator [Brachybacterium endophyticum]